ncbi:MAG: hypothetical protein QXI89_01090 [Candidatus Anstonellales archaeon]
MSLRDKINIELQQYYENKGAFKKHDKNAWAKEPLSENERSKIIKIGSSGLLRKRPYNFLQSVTKLLFEEKSKIIGKKNLYIIGIDHKNNSAYAFEAQKFLTKFIKLFDIECLAFESHVKDDGLCIHSRNSIHAFAKVAYKLCKLIPIADIELGSINKAINYLLSKYPFDKIIEIDTIEAQKEFLNFGVGEFLAMLSINSFIIGESTLKGISFDLLPYTKSTSINDWKRFFFLLYLRDLAFADAIRALINEYDKLAVVVGHAHCRGIITALEEGLGIENEEIKNNFLNAFICIQLPNQQKEHEILSM